MSLKNVIFIFCTGYGLKPKFNFGCRVKCHQNQLQDYMD